jgi:hypothetical protein
LVRNRDENGGGGGGFLRNRDERKDGSGGMNAAVPPMNLDIGMTSFLATWLKKRLSFGRRKREPLSMRVRVVAWGRVPDEFSLCALFRLPQPRPVACGGFQLPDIPIEIFFAICGMFIEAQRVPFRNIHDLEFVRLL